MKKSIIINGKRSRIQSSTISGLFTERKINRTGIVIEVNGKVIHWTKFSRFCIKDGDNINILHFSGGG
ncbi:sulfur carrier protein ThiS [Elusimicrobiota bacterium]